MAMMWAVCLPVSRFAAVKSMVPAVSSLMNMALMTRQMLVLFFIMSTH